jgi:hypothetical protein
MNIMALILWALIGAGLSFLVLATQHWSVMRIDPHKPNISKWLVIGGAFIRWLIIVTFLVLALHNSVTAMLITFFSYQTAKFFILIIWNRSTLNNNYLKLGIKWKL